MCHTAGNHVVAISNEPGLTRISISCDAPAVCARVADSEGEVRSDTDLGVAIFIRDPDGQLLELSPMSYAERVAGSPA
jgi:hypothetical protein